MTKIIIVSGLGCPALEPQVSLTLLYAYSHAPEQKLQVFTSIAIRRLGYCQRVLQDAEYVL